MHQRSPSELQGAPGRRTTQDGAPRGSHLGRGSGRRSPCPPKGAPFWAWLLLGALAVPGARSFLSEEQEELLVELHNHYRGQVSPSASAMLPLRWDPSLKVIAEGYAAKCIWNHNPELEDTGENLFAATGSLDLREALEKWFLEHLDYDFQNNSCDEDQMCGHYTQMVWADTHRVGCAFHLCNNMKSLEWERVSFLVCNYYPAGNYEGERPFVEGEWCSRCPENLQKCENNLCVPVEEEEDEEGGTVVPPPGTSGPSLQPEEEEGEEVVVPPPGTSAPSLQPEEEGEEVVVPPPGTSGPSLVLEEEEEDEVVDPYVQPATTTISASTPSITTTTATAEEDPEDSQPPATPAPATRPPEAHSTPQGEEKKTEEKMEDEKRKLPWEMPAGKEKDVTWFIHTKNSEVSTSGADSASSPFLLLACLTGILTLRL